MYPMLVCLSVRLSVCKLFTFSPEPLSQFQPNLAHRSILRCRGLKFVQMKCHEIFSTYYLGVLCTCKWKIQEVCLRIWCVVRSMTLLLTIDQWVCSLSFVTLWNRGKMVDWKSFWFIFSRCCLEEIHNSICCQLYPELIKPVTLSSTCIFIFSKQSIFLISFNDQLFFMLSILLRL